MTCAVVVSYNRRDLLRDCLGALLAQTERLDEIMVVDNGSDDGSREMLQKEFPQVTRVFSASNTGGAGGFCLGVDLAIRAGHSDAWLMDDDARPMLNAHERLMNAGRLIAEHNTDGRRPGFLTCRIVEPDGTPLTIWQPPPLAEPAPILGVTPLPWTPFVGALVNLDVARRTFLPLADFFIWLDDLEYTARLGRLAGGYAVEDAVIVHPNKAYVKGDFGWRFEHVVKNRLWILRDRELARPGVRAELAKQLLRAIPGQAIRSEDKREFTRALGRGVASGLRRRPTRRWPGEALTGPNAMDYTVV